MNPYKVSFDRQTIVDVPQDKKLYDFIKEQVNGKQILEDSFTRLGLMSNESMELIVILKTKRYKSIRVLAGKKLKAADLTAAYDNFGYQIKNK